MSSTASSVFITVQTSSWFNNQNTLAALMFKKNSAILFKFNVLVFSRLPIRLELIRTYAWAFPVKAHFSMKRLKGDILAGHEKELCEKSERARNRSFVCLRPFKGAMCNISAATEWIKVMVAAMKLSNRKVRDSIHGRQPRSLSGPQQDVFFIQEQSKVLLCELIL